MRIPEQRPYSWSQALAIRQNASGGCPPGGTASCAIHRQSTTTDERADMRLHPTRLTSPKMVHPKPAIAAIAAGLTLVTLAACGGDDSGDTDDTDTTEEAGTDPTDPAGDDTTTTELTPEGEVLAAYEEALDAVEAAFAVPDAEHPDLLAHWAGESLRHLQPDLENMRLNGQAGEVTIESDPVVQLDPENTDKAWVVDCFIDRSQRVDAETREPVGEPSETVAETKRRLERIDGAWKVVENEYLEVDGCTPG